MRVKVKRQPPSADDYASFYIRLYRMFDTVTPLKTDCGAVCGASCCKGDALTGMRLFPHEETKLKTEENENGRFALCSGSCKREERPLSCRIFPLFPALTANGRIRAVPDARAFHVCPLVRQYENVILDPRFIRSVERAGRRMARIEELRAFLTEITEEIGEVSALQNRIGTE